MSYSFNVRTADKASVADALAAEFDKVVASQPVHAADREVALATAAAVLGVIAAPGDGQDISVNVSGWLQWTGSGPDNPEAFGGCNVSVSASNVARQA